MCQNRMHARTVHQIGTTLIIQRCFIITTTAFYGQYMLLITIYNQGLLQSRFYLIEKLDHLYFSVAMLSY